MATGNRCGVGWRVAKATWGSPLARNTSSLMSYVWATHKCSSSNWGAVKGHLYAKGGFEQPAPDVVSSDNAMRYWLINKLMRRSVQFGTTVSPSFTMATSHLDLDRWNIYLLVHLVAPSSHVISWTFSNRKHLRFNVVQFVCLVSIVFQWLRNR